MELNTCFEQLFQIILVLKLYWDCPNGEDEGDLYECDVKWTSNGCCYGIIFIFGKNRYECIFSRNQRVVEAVNSDFDAYMKSFMKLVE